MEALPYWHSNNLLFLLMGCKYEVEGHHDTIEKMLYILLRERPQKLVREGGGGARQKS